MGCFLIITKRDFAQLSNGMRQSLSTSTASSSATVRVQVEETAYESACDMAALIRQYAPSAQVTSAVEDERFEPTVEREIHTVEILKTVDPSLGHLYYSTYIRDIKSKLGGYFHSRGKIGERIAAQVLEQYKNLTIYKDQIARTRGVDVRGRSKSGGAVVAEVKTTSSDEDFGQLLGKGYGHRQCSDEWLKEVNKKNKDFDLTRTEVMGVRINPDTMTVSIYRRIDADAKTWKCIARNLLLSDFNIDPDY